MRINALELLYRLQSNLVNDREQELETEERELIMAIAPLFQEQLQLAKQEGRQEGRQEGIEQGIQQGVQLGQRLILENLLRQRFGELTPEIVSLVSPVTAMSVTEFTSLLLEISMLRVDEIGQQQTLRLLAEKINKIRPNEEN